MADKKESALGAVTDFAQARVLDASGASKNIDKATMASVLAEQMINKEIYIQGKGEHAFDFVGGVICISTPSLQSASAIIAYPMYDNANAKVLNIGGEVFIEGNDATANKFAAWRENDKCYLRNNYNSGITLYYTEIAVKK